MGVWSEHRIQAVWGIENPASTYPTLSPTIDKFPGILETVKFTNDCETKGWRTANGDRSIKVNETGFLNYGMSFEMPLQTAYLLAMALGLDTVSGVSDPYTHTVTKPSPDSALPTFSAEFVYLDTPEEVQVWYGGCVDGFSLKSDPKGELVGAFDLLFANVDTAQSKSSAPSIDTTKPYQHRHIGSNVITLYSGYTIAHLKGLEVNFKNNITLQPLQYQYPTLMCLGAREIDMLITMIPENDDVFDLIGTDTAITGDLTYTRATGPPERSFKLAWTSGLGKAAPHDIGGGDGVITVPLTIDQIMDISIVEKNAQSGAYTTYV